MTLILIWFLTIILNLIPTTNPNLTLIHPNLTLNKTNRNTLPWCIY